MKTYKDVFTRNEHPALIPFLVLGDPDFDRSLELVRAVVEAGADVLELGIPFSDPIADGPTIQRAEIYLNLIASAEKRELESLTMTKYDEKFQVFIALGMMLLIGEIFIREQKKV